MEESICVWKKQAELIICMELLLKEIAIKTEGLGFSLRLELPRLGCGLHVLISSAILAAASFNWFVPCVNMPWASLNTIWMTDLMYLKAVTLKYVHLSMTLAKSLMDVSRNFIVGYYVLVGRVAQCWNVGLWQANFPCPAFYLRLTGDNLCG